MSVKKNIFFASFCSGLSLKRGSADAGTDSVDATDLTDLVDSTNLTDLEDRRIQRI